MTQHPAVPPKSEAQSHVPPRSWFRSDLVFFLLFFPSPGFDYQPHPSRIIDDSSSIIVYRTARKRRKRKGYRQLRRNLYRSNRQKQHARYKSLCPSKIPQTSSIFVPPIHYFCQNRHSRGISASTDSPCPNTTAVAPPTSLSTSTT